MQWDYTTDFIVVGSGAGGMTAAAVAAIEGVDSLVLEKTQYYGGTTALSGGVAWIPNSDSMARAGIPDSEDEAVAYLTQVVGPDVAEDKLRTYARQAPEMVRYMEKYTPLKFYAAKRYADYYPELDGGKPGGRSMEPRRFNRKKLGKEAANQRFPDYLTGLMKFAVTVKESREMMDMSFKGNLYMLRNMLLFYLDIPSRLKKLPDCRYTLGRALVASCRRALLDLKVPLWLNAESKALIVEQGRVIGVRIEKDGKSMNLKANKGVMLAAGGMGNNVEMRQRYGL
jgi:3-oxosteroid 1-dehydrogenase